MSQKHVAVLMGGRGIAEALQQAGYRVTPIDVTRDIASVLKDLKPDVAFNALHGNPGEDGTIQGILEIMQIPYTHSGVMASAVAMNKDKAKVMMAAAGVPVPTGRLVSRFEAAKSHILPRPYVIKPNAEGSSVGVFIVRDDHLHPPQELTSSEWKLGEQVLVEKFIAGRELTCAVMGEKALGVTEIIANTKFYDYEAKYAEGGSTHICPAKLSLNIYRTIQELALTAHRALGCRGVSRADFRYDDTPGGTGDLVCLEVNTQPGMTQTSLVPELAAHEGLSFVELVTWIVEDASLDR
jgi:D-alanine-D-alanine ligase